MTDVGFIDGDNINSPIIDFGGIELLITWLVERKPVLARFVSYQ
jgi:hypothetical protein